MNLIPLYPATPRSCAASLRIRCVKCAAMDTYATAVDNGWTYDIEGVPFRDIYCEQCSKKEVATVA